MRIVINLDAVSEWFLWFVAGVALLLMWLGLSDLLQ